MKIKILLLIPLFCGLFLNAQNTFNENELDSLKIMIISPYKPEVKDAYKRYSNPILDDSTQVLKEVDYTIYPVLAKVDFELNPINPATLKNLKLEKLKKIGFEFLAGNRTTLEGSIIYNSDYNKKFSYGAEFNHKSANGNISNLPFPQYIDDKVNLYSKLIFKENILNTNLNVIRNAYSLYGFDSTLLNIDKNDINQRLNKINFGCSFDRYKDDSSKLFYKSNLYLNYFNELNNSTYDNYLALDVMLRKFIEKEEVKLYIKSDVGLEQNLVDTIVPFFMSTKLEIDHNIGDLSLNLAFDLSLMKDNNVQQQKLYPIINVCYEPKNGHYKLYAGYLGSSGRLHYSSLFDENYWINTNSQMRFIHVKSNPYLGFKSLITPKLSYSLRFDYSEVANMPLYVLNLMSVNKNDFDVIFDDITMYKFNFNLTYRLKEKIQISLDATYNDLNSTFENYAWNVPQRKVDFLFIYNLGDKIILTSDIFYEGLRYYKESTSNIFPKSVKGDLFKDIIDANLKFEYKYSNRLSAFLDFRNISSQKYLVYNNYPVYGFTVLGGFKYSL